ncbi:MAG: hypothetical protein GY822_25625 [Deltaproteobacteria bacterium]|nr:hypothetical protein [Deltaproteobacteria bacterium]
MSKMESTPDALPERDQHHKPVLIGVVLPELMSVQKLITQLASLDAVNETEFTFGAPLYKGNDAIRENLPKTTSALEKFNCYFEHGILDEEARVGFAQAFRKKYIQKLPGSEGSDVFLASAEVLQFRYRLDLPTSAEALQALAPVVEKHPHDPAVIADLKEGRGLAKDQLSGWLKIFLDHVYNPRRRKLPEVEEVLFGSRRKDAVVLELAVSGGAPGLHHEVFEPLVDELDGAMVWLPG